MVEKLKPHAVYRRMDCLASIAHGVLKTKPAPRPDLSKLSSIELLRYVGTVRGLKNKLRLAHKLRALDVIFEDYDAKLAARDSIESFVEDLRNKDI